LLNKLHKNTTFLRKLNYEVIFITVLTRIIVDHLFLYIFVNWNHSFRTRTSKYHKKYLKTMGFGV